MTNEIPKILDWLFENCDDLESVEFEREEIILNFNFFTSESGVTNVPWSIREFTPESPTRKKLERLSELTGRS